MIGPFSSVAWIAMWTMSRFGAAPCQWLSPGSEEDAIARADLLNGAALALAASHALGDEDGLPEGVGVPVRASAGSEVDVAGPGACRRVRGVDEDDPSEPVAGALSAVKRAAGDLHRVLLGRWGISVVQAGTRSRARSAIRAGVPSAARRRRRRTASWEKAVIANASARRTAAPVSDAETRVDSSTRPVAPPPAVTNRVVRIPSPIALPVGLPSTRRGAVQHVRRVPCGAGDNNRPLS
jgi:hypothetical protein